MDDWASELIQHSHRDQLSFNYVLWKHDYKISDMKVIYRRRYFKVNPHNHMIEEKKKRLEEIRNSKTTR